MDYNLDDLKKYRNKLLNEVEQINDRLLAVGVSGTSEAVELNKKLRNIKEKISKLDREIYFTIPPINTNGILDLREGVEGRYNLYLSGTDIYVGFIEYKGYHISRRTGDVGCKIDSKYRGKGYAYYANQLLGDLLYKNNIMDFWGTAFKDNIGSIKLMEKYGGIKIADGEIPGVVLYECKTKPLNEKVINHVR